MTETRSKRPHPALRWIGARNRFGQVIYPIGAVAILSVPAVLIYQFIQWWDSGHWPVLSVAQALDWYGVNAPSFETAWIQNANQQMLDSPLSLVLFLAIAGPLYTYALFSKWLAYYCGPPEVLADDGPL